MTRSVLLVGNFLSASVGNRGVCEELAERLAGSAWKVFTTSTRPGRIARLTDMLAAAWRHRRDYEVAHIDVYSGAAFVWAEAVAGLLRRIGKPYVLTLHGGDLPPFAGKHPRRVRDLLASAQIVTAPSRYLLQKMRPYREDLRLIPNALDLSRYPLRVREAVQPRLIWLRAFHDIYAPTDAIECLAALRKEAPAATLTMVGPDKGDGSLHRTQTAVTACGVEDAVSFYGAVPKQDVGAWLDRGDIFLNTSTIDNTPVSVLEAMACGACVVSTRVGGIPYLLDDETDALLVNPRDPRAMAGAVHRLITNPELAARLSVNARAKAEQFDWTAILPLWHSLLGEAQIRRDHASVPAGVATQRR